jgi:hypothetical protein
MKPQRPLLSERRLLTTNHAAQYLDMSRDKFICLGLSMKLKKIRIGRMDYYGREELDKWAAEQVKSVFD